VTAACFYWKPSGTTHFVQESVSVLPMMMTPQNKQVASDGNVC